MNNDGHLIHHIFNMFDMFHFRVSLATIFAVQHFQFIAIKKCCISLSGPLTSSTIVCSFGERSVYQTVETRIEWVQTFV